MAGMEAADLEDLNLLHQVEREREIIIAYRRRSDGKDAASPEATG